MLLRAHSEERRGALPVHVQACSLCTVRDLPCVRVSRCLHVSACPVYLCSSLCRMCMQTCILILVVPYACFNVLMCLRAMCACAAIVTYSPGLVGFPLQQCCPQLDSPHVVDCGVAGGDPLPNECWFNLYKVCVCVCVCVCSAQAVHLVVCTCVHRMVRHAHERTCAGLMICIFVAVHARLLARNAQPGTDRAHPSYCMGLRFSGSRIPFLVPHRITLCVSVSWHAGWGQVRGTSERRGSYYAAIKGMLQCILPRALCITAHSA